jgi:CubicO group peptidase (beta-lactamase class C family)
MQARKLGGIWRYALTPMAALAGQTSSIAQPATVASHEFVSPDAAKLGFSTERLKAITSAYSEGVSAGEIPGAVVMIARDGELVYSAAIGYRDIAAKQPMQPDSRFYLASMTKPLTTVAAMMLVEEGRLLLDEPVAKHIPELAGLGVGREATGPDRKPSITVAKVGEV